jgi:hypothetical protein
VRVTDLFKNIPVRRQTVLKSTAKTIAKIKKIIQSYAIAQPTIRLSLKVLKAANEKANWVYAPGKNASLMDAALKVAGTEVASACVTKQWPCANESDEESGVGNGGSFQLMAILANPGSGIYSTHWTESLADVRRFFKSEQCGTVFQCGRQTTLSISGHWTGDLKAVQVLSTSSCFE